MYQWMYIRRYVCIPVHSTHQYVYYYISWGFHKWGYLLMDGFFHGTSLYLSDNAQFNIIWVSILHQANFSKLWSHWVPRATACDAQGFKRNEKLIPRASSYSNGKMNNYPFRVLSLFQKKNTGRISIQIERFVAFLKLWSPWNSPRDWNQRWIPVFSLRQSGAGCMAMDRIPYHFVPNWRYQVSNHQGNIPRTWWQIRSYSPRGMASWESATNYKHLQRGLVA